MRRPAARDGEARRVLTDLCAGDVGIRGAAEMIEGYVASIREGRAEDLSDWLGRARECSAPEVRAFAERLGQDEAAVRDGVAVEWSNGPVEGRVNRLEATRRATFGRARFDLLRARVLAAG